MIAADSNTHATLQYIRVLWSSVYSIRFGRWSMSKTIQVQ